MRLHEKVVRFFLIVAGVALAVALVAVGYGMFALARTSAAPRDGLESSSVADANGVGSSPTTPAVAQNATITSTVASSSTASVSAIPSPTPAPAKAKAPAPRAASTTTSGKLDAYRGLGSWVDIYDAKAWRDPAATVSDMASHGVRTLFIETGNSRSSTDIFNPTALATFIRECHARNMRVVAWFLPDLKPGAPDYSRIAQAIAFTTSDGQKFDSFALDIESTAVSSEAARNRSLEALTKRIRSLVGPSYALGAIIPSPVGLAKKAGYWNDFPYTMIAGYYDVFVPMAYYTYHGSTATAAGADALNNVRILHAQKGCATVPIHMIGGISDDSSTAEVRAFVSAVLQTQCFGASLYGWVGTTAADWSALQAIPR
jgi:hypothetical protein